MQELTSYIYCKERLLKYNNINILYNYVQSVSVNMTDSLTSVHDLLNSVARQRMSVATRAPLLIPRGTDSSWNPAITGLVAYPSQAGHRKRATSATRNDANYIRTEVTIIRIQQLYNAMRQII